MNDRLRRNARLIAGSLALVLAAGVAYVLHSAGSAHAQPARAARRVHAIAPVLASASPRPAPSVARAASSRSRHSVRSATVLPRRGRPGLPTAAPSSRTVSSALHELTGLTAAQVRTRAVCPPATPGRATCAAQALVLRSSGALVRAHVPRYRAPGRASHASAGPVRPANVPAATAPDPGTPAYLQQAYDLSYLSQNGGANDTVAIVDAYDDPTAEEDLGTYRANYGLPACTTENGCFQKVGQDGSSSLPAADQGWEQEISLDLDSVSAICPLCHILLVEANSNKFSDLETGMQTAAGLGANQISASWFGTSKAVPPMFRTFSGIATVAASGDYGYPGAGQDNYPAALPGVTAAGGTSLAPASVPGARGFGESAWSWNGLNGGGSGCDLQFHRPAYQPADGCLGRAYADISADADPQTGLAVYNHGNWSVVGGTSLATPLIAAYYAVTGVSDATPQWAYGAGADLNDIVSGSTGTCADSISYICNAVPGYDGPTGMGSISGAVVTGAPGIDGPSISSSSGNTYTESTADHAATITGGIYRNGLDTSWWIEYGPTASYGSQTPAEDIGAGSTPVAVTGYLSQLTPGTTYHYRLVAQNSLGMTDGYDYTFTTPAAPAGAPTAAFTLSPTSPTPGAPVAFTSTSTVPAGSTITDYSWNFGDGSTADKGTTKTASHTYAARGTYTVTLTVKTSHGQSDTSTQTITVDNPPTAAFQASSTAVPAGATVTFDGSASTPGAGGSLTDYSWSFDDGSTADGGANATESHTFTSPGTYNVSLTTTDDLDVSNTTTQSITVASFTANPAIPAPGSQVTFTAEDPGNPECGTVTGYTWDFGDGSQPQTTTTPSISYTYAARGSYSVSLTYQCSGTAIPQSGASVNVDSPPTAAFTPSATAFVPGTTVNFDGSASSPAAGGTITDYAWSFGDGSPVQHTGTTPTTSHTFDTPGTYTVTLTTTDELGASATVSEQVTADEPTAAFAVSSPSPAPNSPVSFDASSSSDPESPITDYTWSFGDGAPVDAGASAVITHSFSAAGTYTVKLTVTDQLGLTDTLSRQVVIAPAVSESSNPPTTTTTTTTTPAPPTTTTTVSSAPPTTSPPVTRTQAPLSLVVQLSGAGRQRLTRALAHGLRLGLTVNQRTRAGFQITIPLAQTKQGSSGKGHPKGTVVLLRGVQTLGAGKHSIVLKLSRAAARRLAVRGPLVLTVRVTLAATGGGAPVTRTIKLTLTR